MAQLQPEFHHEWNAGPGGGNRQDHPGRQRLLDEYDDAEIQAIINLYAQAYGDSGLTAEEVLEEILCDSIGKMNAFATESTRSLAGEVGVFLRNVRKNVRRQEGGQKKSGNRDGGVVNSQEFRGFSTDKYFDRQVDNWEEMNEGAKIKVGVVKKGSALNQVGFPAEGMWFDVGKIRKSMNDHDDHLTKTIIKNIPNLLSDPIATTEYKGPKGIMTNTASVYGMMMPNGKTPIVVGVMMTKAANGVAVINKVRTIHARGNAIINDENILYLNEDKKEPKTGSKFAASLCR